MARLSAAEGVAHIRYSTSLINRLPVFAPPAYAYSYAAHGSSRPSIDWSPAFFSGLL